MLKTIHLTLIAAFQQIFFFSNDLESHNCSQTKTLINMKQCKSDMKLWSKRFTTPLLTHCCKTLPSLDVRPESASQT